MECDIKYKRWEQRLTHMAMQGRPKKKICIEHTKTQFCDYLKSALLVS